MAAVLNNAATSRLDSALEFERDGRLLPVPALDGLRGLAVVAVVLFHGGFGFARGGFLGVSLFFTLSGFLITSLLLTELRERGSIDLHRFWTRRFRRLLPAAWLTILAVGIAAVALDTVSPSLRGDLWAAAAQVANWRFLLDGRSYSTLFSDPSPVLHFWSLAIEEQFYFVFPLLFVGLSRVTGGKRPAMGIAFGLGAVASFLLPLVAGFGIDRTYYGTDTRAGELLVGAALAVLVSSKAFRRRLLLRFWGRVVAASMATLALVATVVMWVVIDEGSDLINGGLLAVVGCCSCLAILGAIVPTGPTNVALSFRPLGALGRISYGIYLFHWPALVWTGTVDPGSGSEGRHAVQFAFVMAAVFAAAAASHRMVEMPIRHGRLNRRTLRTLAVVGVLALISGPIAMSTRVDPAQQVLADLEDASLGVPRSPSPPQHPSSTNASQPPPTSTPVPARTPTGAASTRPIPDPPVVAVFGDSIMLSLALVLDSWNEAQHKFISGHGVARLGCGVLSGGTILFERVQPMPTECDDWADAWPRAVRAAQADVSVISSCQWEAVDRQLPGTDAMSWLGNPAYDAQIKDGFLTAVDLLTEAGTKLVIWVDCPHFSLKTGVKGLAEGLLRSREPERIDRLNELIDEVAAQRPLTVRVLPWHIWTNERVDDDTIRPDGSHYDWKNDTGVGRAFGPMLMDTINRFRSEQTGR